MPPAEFFTILMCPVCATTIDAEVRSEPYRFSWECTNCETYTEVTIQADRVKQHAMHG